jgi:hypothetical protein
MENLILRKEEIIKKHEDRLSEVNADILKLMTDSIKDKKAGAGGGAGGGVNVGLFESLKASLQFNSESSLGIEGHDRLEYSKMWFENAKFMVESLKNDPGYQSVIKDIDEQLELYRKEINQIDEELMKVEDDSRRKKLMEEKQKGWKRAT